MRARLEYALFLLIRRLILLLPLRSVQHLGDAVGLLAYRLVSSRRAVALENLGYAFPELTDAERSRIARDAFRNYAVALFEFLWFPRLDDRTLRELVSIPSTQKIVDTVAAGKGLILLSGHFGNWELDAFAAARISGEPFTIIVQTQSNKLVDRVINEHRCLMGNSVVPMGIGVRDILRALHGGKVVAIAPDQSGPREGVFVNFFGRMVATHQGPAVFALRTGAPMMLGSLIRQQDGRYEVLLEDVPADGLPEGEEEAVVELTQRHTALLERIIRKHPGQWLWMHRRWKHTLESVQREDRLRRETAPL